MSLKAENLSFSYENGGRHVLTRISLKIEPGERVGLVAPSGYGKTTLCRLLAGYERPEAGTVEIDSIPIENIRGCMPVQLIWQHPEQVLSLIHIWERHSGGRLRDGGSLRQPGI